MNKNCPPLTEFDQLTLGNSTQIIKAILPFFDVRTQRILSIFIRIRELMTTIDFYRNRAAGVFAKGGRFNQSDLLNVLRKYCPDINLDMVDSFNTFMQMENMMSAMSGTAESDNSDGFNMAQNMMNPEQQKSYERFLKELENLDFESEENNE